jgi:hypothetical protein
MLIHKHKTKFISSKAAIPHRDQHGSMLTMTIFCIVIILVVCVIGFSFYLLLTQQERQQTVADNIALSLAKTINEGDRIGQMNNLVTLNRELVYNSRQISGATTSSDLYFCSPLAQQLLYEARSSADDIEKERENQIEIAKAALHYQVDNYNVNTKNAPQLHLPWWQSYDPQIYKVNLGSIAGVTSNVVHNDVFQPLTDYDTLQRHYVQKKSNLYFGNISAKLPEPDTDLDFKLTSLPAPVETTVAPARLANGEMFTPAGTIFAEGKYVPANFDQIPTAVQVLATMKVSSANNKSELLVSSVAACNGDLHPIPNPDTSMNMMSPPK